MELQLQHQSSSEYSGLISFRIDWFDPLVVQGTLKSLLQHCSLKASILIPGNLFFSVRQCHSVDVMGGKMLSQVNMVGFLLKTE